MVRPVVVSLKLGIVAALVVACSSSSTTPEQSSDPTQPAGTSTAKTPATPPATPPTPPADTPKTGDAACADQAGQACQQCCITNHQTGYQTYLSALLECACGGKGADAGAGVCATECKATACQATPSQPDQACDTCLQNALSSQTSACAKPVSTACQGDKDCVAVLTCAQKCK